MTRIAGGSDSQQKIFKMLSFADYGTNHKLTAARDVADPWYTGDFDATFDDVISGCRGLLEYIKEVYNLQLQQLKDNNSSGYGAEHSCDN